MLRGDLHYFTLGVQNGFIASLSLQIIRFVLSSFSMKCDHCGELRTETCQQPEK